MSNIDFPSNSNKDRESIEKRAVVPVTSGAKMREKSAFRKAASAFMNEDAGSVKNFIIFDVVVPAIKTLIVDIVENTVEMIFGVSSTRNRSTGGNRNVPYASYYKSDNRNNRRNDPADRDSRPDTRDIEFPSRGEAEAALDELVDWIEHYGSVSISTYKELAGITGDFVDEKWGWTNLRTAYVKRLSGGSYILVMPRPEPID